ncbi:MAG: futalosine hydrolase [Fibrobacter sp.]|nr:futalosine hydrolase [Fibrobacter sp.]
MNKTLVVFASRQEFNTIFPQISAVVASSMPVAVGTQYDVAVCGVGVVDFSVNLSYQLSRYHYERVFLLGICGAYCRRDIKVGDVVRVDTETLGDMGVQNSEGHFIPWREVSGEQVVYAGESPRFLPIGLATLPSVVGLTVNCCTGTQYLSLRRSGMFQADVETMEGAACFAVCKKFGVSAYQFRAVSNIATNRDPSTWKIAEALNTLKDVVLRPEYFEK